MAAVGADQLAFAIECAVLELTDPDIAFAALVAAPAFQAIVTKGTDVLVAFGAVEGATAFELAVNKMATELVTTGVTANTFAIGFAAGEQALVLTAIVQLQLPGAIVLVVFELAAIHQAVFFQGAFTLPATELEATGIAAARCIQGALAVKQALLELAAVYLAIAAMPLALTVPLAIVEIAGVPAAIGVVDTSLTLQQAIDHLAPEAAAIGQAGVRWGQWLAIATGGEQQGQGKGDEWAHGGVRAGDAPSMPHNVLAETATAAVSVAGRFRQSRASAARQCKQAFPGLRFPGWR
ncbi:hypothetical protein D3C78_880210 [compost metagenome]